MKAGQLFPCPLLSRWHEDDDWLAGANQRDGSLETSHLETWGADYRSKLCGHNKTFTYKSVKLFSSIFFDATEMADHSFYSIFQIMKNGIIK